LPVRVSISLARSVLDGSAMEKAEAAEFGEGGGLLVGMVAEAGAVAEVDEEDWHDRDTRLSRALMPRVGGPRLRRS
jgi:hypothetical protein